jgi:hypothetical protein
MTTIVHKIVQPILSKKKIYTLMFAWYQKQREIYIIIYGYDPLMKKNNIYKRYNYLKKRWDEKYNNNYRRKKPIELVPYGFDFNSCRLIGTYTKLFEVYNVFKDKNKLIYCKYMHIKN